MGVKTCHHPQNMVEASGGTKNFKPFQLTTPRTRVHKATSTAAF